jgi:hypothetical protein
MTNRTFQNLSLFALSAGMAMMSLTACEAPGSEGVYSGSDLEVASLPCQYKGLDIDGDGICGDDDICEGFPNDDEDRDGVCDNIDFCVGNDETGDHDGDGVCGDIDICEGDDSTGNYDGDEDCNEIDPVYVGVAEFFIENAGSRDCYELEKDSTIYVFCVTDDAEFEYIDVADTLEDVEVIVNGAVSGYKSAYQGACDDGDTACINTYNDCIAGTANLDVANDLCLDTTRENLNSYVEDAINDEISYALDFLIAADVLPKLHQIEESCDNYDYSVAPVCDYLYPDRHDDAPEENTTEEV